MIDTHFPWKLSGFRYHESLELLRQRPDTVFFSLLELTDPFPVPVLPLASFPEVAHELGVTDVYWVFLSTSIGLLGLDETGSEAVMSPRDRFVLANTFKGLGIRRHVMLWPGGGMIGSTPASLLSAVGQELDTVFTNVREVEEAIPTALYVPMAVDTGHYHPRARDFHSGPLRLVFAGADSDRKGLRLLLEAMRLLPTDRFTLTVIGPHHRQGHLLAAPNVEVLDWLSPEALRDVYWRSHAFVSPATIETQNELELGMIDGFPTTTGSDAMAAGCALVAANPRCEHRALVPGTHYIDVRVDDMEDLASALLAAERDRRGLEAIAIRGSDRVAEFSISRIVSGKLEAMGLTPTSDEKSGTSDEKSGTSRQAWIARVARASNSFRNHRPGGDQAIAELTAAVQRLLKVTDNLAHGQLVLRQQVADLSERVDKDLANIGGELWRTRELVKQAVDVAPDPRTALDALRRTREYETAYDEAEPLVTVRIATYNLAETLVERALASVRAQTYERLEVIVVGDRCTDDTADRIRRIGDPRIRFVNLTAQGPYPAVPYRWLVAGAPGMATGAGLAIGSWIAPLDDDDEFTPDHVAVLLQAAREHLAEVAYGDILQHGVGDAPDEVLGSDPPSFGHFGLQASVYHAMLRYFPYNTKSWLMDEPADWNLTRRMMESGVRFHRVSRIVTNYYPSTLHAPRRHGLDP